VDGALLVDQWHDGFGSYSSPDIYLAEGTHQVWVEMYEHTGNAMVRLRWEQSTGTAGWRGSYFPNPDLEGEPVFVRYSPDIDFDWGAGAPAPGLPSDHFSVKFVRKMDFDPGVYRFCASADDGVSVEMNDQLPYIIREWHDGSGTYCNDVYIPAGHHKVTVEYYEHLGGAMIQFWWQKLADG
jgi:hypothetical protein